MNASIAIVCKRLGSDSRVVTFLSEYICRRHEKVFSERSFSPHCIQLNVIMLASRAFVRSAFCHRSSLPMRIYTALPAKSLRASRVQYLFRDATAKRRNKRGRTPTICLGETPSQRCNRQLIVSRRNVLLVSLHLYTTPNPLRFILPPFRNVGCHFCSRDTIMLSIFSI